MREAIEEVLEEDAAIVKGQAQMKVQKCYAVKVRVIPLPPSLKNAQVWVQWSS